MYYSTIYPSPIGAIALACDGEGNNLVGLWTEGQKYHGDTIPEAMIKNDDIPLFDTTKQWLDRYFAGKKPSIDELPLAPIGGEFRQGVWNILRQIPYGEVITYGGIATQHENGQGAVLAVKLPFAASVLRYVHIRRNT